MPRPALPRYRADLVIAVELSAEDAEHAAQRFEALADLTRARLSATIRGARLGASEALTVEVLTDPSGV